MTTPRNFAAWGAFPMVRITKDLDDWEGLPTAEFTTLGVPMPEDTTNGAGSLLIQIAKGAARRAAKLAANTTTGGGFFVQVYLDVPAVGILRPWIWRANQACPGEVRLVWPAELFK